MCARISFFCFLFLFGSKISATPTDSIHKNRLIGVSTATAMTFGGSIAALSQVWYSDFPKTKLHSFDDSKQWLQMDKYGHVFTAYQLSQFSAHTFEWTGLDREKCAWVGAGVGWGYQFSLELLDGRSAAWGFSWSDLTANTLGSGLFLAQELAWKKQRLQLKFSYSPTNYADFRPEVLGSSFSERILKDYNGQTYWISIAPAQFLLNTNIPNWLAVAIGFSADAKIYGDYNTFITPDGMTKFKANREFILSLDLRVDELPIKRKWIKTMLKPFDVIKVPFPALVLRGKQLSGSWMYF